MSALYYKVLGEGEPIILLHGLLGMSDNLGSLAKTLAEDYKVIAIDAINHGESPHQAVVSYNSMADDVIAVMDKLGFNKAFILGHSMGGKTAMQLAINAPERVSALIVADIAPVEYPTSYHTDLFAAMKAVSQEIIHSRKDADSILEKHGVNTLGVRQFLLKNLKRDEQGQWAWQCALDYLIANYPAVSAAPALGEGYPGPSLFIKGGASNYVQEEHLPIIAQYFPQSTVKEIQGASHWLHAEYPQVFAQYVLDFLADNMAKA